MQIVFLSLSVIAGPARFFLGSLTVNDLIFSLIEVEHSVEFIEPRRLGLQFILLGERLLNLKLCVFELDLRVFELRFTGCQLLLEAVQGIVQSLDITENVGAQRYRMPQLMQTKKKSPPFTVAFRRTTVWTEKTTVFRIKKSF